MDHNVKLYNCASQKLYMPFILQVPAWICTSAALRNLSTMRIISDNSYGADFIEAKSRFLQMSNEGKFRVISIQSWATVHAPWLTHVPKHDFLLFQDSDGSQISH